MTKVLAVLLLVVAGALVFTVIQTRRQSGGAAITTYEPRPIAQRPDDGKLGADEQQTIDVFEATKDAVVHITSLETRKDRMTLNATDIPQGTGTGFVWELDGSIVTNYHVVQHGDAASVKLANGKVYRATIVGKAPDKDIAVLHIEAPPSALKKIALGESSKLKVGQKVLAIGNPFGLDQTLTTGVISGLGREIKSVTERSIFDVIQTDASINPGNSGGPLLDSSGRLIGINTAIYSPSGANAGIGFAVPVDTVNAIVPQLLTHGKIVRPGMGINILSDHTAAQQNISGVVILGVAPGGAADRAGIVGTQPAPGGGWEIGDIIVGIDGADVKRSSDLYKALDAHKVGDQVELTLENDGKRRKVKVELQALP
ncbi:MAG: trypsin-like peptidase domain-containing protein [Deltaproteobacteria bacterium]|nr:trypsin-like peptidase domain-containing protein [Deltaproteobacteria bacterium]MCW5805092.1 trypsin-like peptidase domain-containing protein [Deltaproteobacteria bacterium]